MLSFFLFLNFWLFITFSYNSVKPLISLLNSGMRITLFIFVIAIKMFPVFIRCISMRVTFSEFRTDNFFFLIYWCMACLDPLPMVTSSSSYFLLLLSYCSQCFHYVQLQTIKFLNLQFLNQHIALTRQHFKSTMILFR